MLDSLDLREHFDKLAKAQADKQSDAEHSDEKHLDEVFGKNEAPRGRELGAILDNLTRDNVNLPEHYRQFKLEPIMFIGENGLDWFQGNIVKYALRHKLKNGKEDLLKVIRYAQMYILKEYDGSQDWWKAPSK